MQCMMPLFTCRATETRNIHSKYLIDGSPWQDYSWDFQTHISILSLLTGLISPGTLGIFQDIFYLGIIGDAATPETPVSTLPKSVPKFRVVC
jgi:hypothetical protein